MNNIIIIGFMGVGKTSVSKALANSLRMDLIILDEIIIEKEGMSINNIFKEYGEEYFRNSETSSLKGLLYVKNSVISGGGGIVLRDKNIQVMNTIGKVVLLTASVETIFNRVKDNAERPILKDNMNKEFIVSLLENRSEMYLKASDIIVNTDNKSVVEVCQEIITKLEYISS